MTVPKTRWAEWVLEGDAPGAPWSGLQSYFSISTRFPKPDIQPGERVYIVAFGRLRGYAPLVELYERLSSVSDVVMERFLVREGGAVAVTIDEPIVGFRGWRYRWWDRAAERPFYAWSAVRA